MELVRGQNEAQPCAFTESALLNYRNILDRRQVVTLEDLGSVIDSTALISGLIWVG